MGIYTPGSTCPRQQAAIEFKRKCPLQNVEVALIIIVGNTASIIAFVISKIKLKENSCLRWYEKFA